MANLFMIIAPYFSWVFAITLSLHVVKNFRLGKYASGSIFGWTTAGLSHTVLAIYMFSIHQPIIGAQQAVCACLAFSLVVQSLVFSHAK